MDGFVSSRISEDGTLLNYTWNDTTILQKPPTPSVFAWDDAAWVMSACFIIFGMQTGFGMLESGCVSLKNEVNIMMKNVVDVVLGGITYWAFGYGLSYGQDYHNQFFSLGNLDLLVHLDYRRLSRNIKDYQRISKNIEEYQGISRNIKDYIFTE